MNLWHKMKILDRIIVEEDIESFMEWGLEQSYIERFFSFISIIKKIFIPIFEVLVDVLVPILEVIDDVCKNQVFLKE